MSSLIEKKSFQSMGSPNDVSDFLMLNEKVANPNATTYGYCENSMCFSTKMEPNAKIITFGYCGF